MEQGLERQIDASQDILLVHWHLFKKGYNVLGSHSQTKVVP
jgi:hypothetical protein